MKRLQVIDRESGEVVNTFDVPPTYRVARLRQFELSVGEMLGAGYVTDWVCAP